MPSVLAAVQDGLDPLRVPTTVIAADDLPAMAADPPLKTVVDLSR